MWHLAWKGFYVGFLVAFPVGPVAVVLADMTVRSNGWRRWPIAAFLSGAVLCVHTVLALTGAGLITDVITHYPVHIYLFMAALICYVAWRAWQSGKDAVTDAFIAEHSGSIYGPGLLSLLCPVTSFLMLNIFAADASLRVEMLWHEVAFVSLWASIGGGLTYTMMMVFVRVCTARVSRRLVRIFTRIAPVIIMGYAVRSFWIALDYWRKTL